MHAMFLKSLSSQDAEKASDRPIHQPAKRQRAVGGNSEMQAPRKATKQQEPKPTCKNCKQTAGSRCQKTLCGSCCPGECGQDSHGAKEEEQEPPTCDNCGKSGSAKCAFKQCTTCCKGPCTHPRHPKEAPLPRRPHRGRGSAGEGTYAGREETPRRSSSRARSERFGSG